MKQSFRGFQCHPDTSLIIGDPLEMVLFLQTVCMYAGINSYIEDTQELLSTLDEQIKSRFSPELKVTAYDADTMTEATIKSEEIYIRISPISEIMVH